MINSSNSDLGQEGGGVVAVFHRGFAQSGVAHPWSQVLSFFFVTIDFIIIILVNHFVFSAHALNDD